MKEFTLWDQRIANKLNSYADILYYAKKRTPNAMFHSYHPMDFEGLGKDMNTAAMNEIQVRHPALVATDNPDMSTTVVGQKIDLPIILSSVGGLRGAHQDGEIAIARAAGEAGTIYYVSGMTSTPIEKIMAEATGPVFQQIYFIGSRELAKANVERAIKAGVHGLVLISDWSMPPEPGVLNPAERRFMPTEVTFANAVKFLPQLWNRPAWALNFLRNGLKAPMAEYSRGADGKALSFFEGSAILTNEPAVWDDVKWIRDMWKGPLILKGIVRPEDARKAVEVGADGVVVSNHVTSRPGRRMPTIRALPDVVAEVGSEIDVLFDGGIRSGLDAVKALALGAKAVGIGQIQVDALMAAGEPGVKRLMQILTGQVSAAMQHVAAPTVNDIDPAHFVVPAEWKEPLTTLGDVSNAARQRAAARSGSAAGGAAAAK